MITSPSLAHYVSHALAHLYDPYVLRVHPLIAKLNYAPQPNIHAVLRDTLIASIEALKPSPNIPPDSRAWRVYKILNLHYIQQLKQDQVAYQLGISVRHLRREQQAAVQILADALAKKYDLPEAAIAAPDSSELIDLDGENSFADELMWLKDSTQESSAAVAESLEFAFHLVLPLARNCEVQLELCPLPALPPVVINPMALRQALVSMATGAINRVPGGQVQFSALEQNKRVVLKVCALGKEILKPVSSEGAASLSAAHTLVSMYDGTLETIAQGSTYSATLSLVVAEATRIIVIDDNPDIRQLLERYAAGPRFHLTGIQSAENLFDLITEQRPDLIILDVMMPGIDGWQLLGHLRQHPLTNTVPIVICSILPERELAMALGAAAYLPKPVSRAGFLELLDQIVGAK